MSDVSYKLNGEIYWPDTCVGSELYYGFNWATWLTNEGDTFVSMTWDSLPTGLTTTDDYDADNESFIKIVAGTAGGYEITGSMASIEAGKTQLKTVKAHLTVK